MRLLTARELHEQHGISPGTAYRLAKRGLIPSYRIGPRLTGVRFVSEEVLQALRRPAVTKEPGQ